MEYEEINEKEPIFEYLESVCEFVPVLFWWGILDKIALSGNKVGFKFKNIG